MPQDTIVSIPPIHLFFPLVSIVLLTIAIIVGFDCVWRVEKRLDTFMKLLTTGIIFRVLAEIMSLFLPVGEWIPVCGNIASSFFILLAVIEMYKIIKTWDNENPPKQEDKTVV